MSKAKINKDTRKITCTSCNRSLVLNSSNFYKSTKSEYEKTDGFCYICKSCVRQLCFNSDNTINMNGLLQALEMLDKPFIKVEYMKILSKGSFDIGTYLKNVSFNSYKGMTFTDSDGNDKEDILLDNDFKDNLNQNEYKDENNKDIVLTDEDIQMQKDVIKLLGYDPFAGYSTLDRKFLYAELLPYLDEETLEDQYKVSVIMQILNNNNQVRKIDFVINKLSSDTKSLLQNSGEVKSLTAIKNQIGQVSDKLSKENAIAIKHRGDKRAGKSTLGAIMKDLRELNFDNAEEDYYDMKKAYGMQVTADISNKSILSQLNFDEKDIDDMFKTQRSLIKELQNKNMELEEKLRQVSEELIKIKETGDNIG